MSLARQLTCTTSHQDPPPTVQDNSTVIPEGEPPQATKTEYVTMVKETDAGLPASGMETLVIWYRQVADYYKIPMHHAPSPQIMGQKKFDECGEKIMKVFPSLHHMGSNPSDKQSMGIMHWHTAKTADSLNLDEGSELHTVQKAGNLPSVYYNNENRARALWALFNTPDQGYYRNFPFIPGNPGPNFEGELPLVMEHVDNPSYKTTGEHGALKDLEIGTKTFAAGLTAEIVAHNDGKVVYFTGHNINPTVYEEEQKFLFTDEDGVTWTALHLAHTADTNVRPWTRNPEDQGQIYLFCSKPSWELNIPIEEPEPASA